MAKKIKAAKSDLQITSLPSTRKEVFFDVLKLHFRSFLGYGLLFLLFTLPFHILAIRDDIIVAGITAGLEGLGDAERQAVIVQILSVKNTSALINVLSFAILSFFLSGMLRVIRLYSWEENVFFAFDFMKGVKQNIKQLLPLSLTVGIANALMVYAISLAALTTKGLLALALAMAVCAVCVIGIPTVAYTVISISLYEHTLAGHIKLGLMMASKGFLKTLCALLFCLVPYALQMLPNIYCHIIGRVLGSMLSPIVLLGWYLFSLDRFDEFVNKLKFPELVGKGTFNTDKTE